MRTGRALASPVGIYGKRGVSVNGQFRLLITVPLCAPGDSIGAGLSGGSQVLNGVSQARPCQAPRCLRRKPRIAGVDRMPGSPSVRAGASPLRGTLPSPPTAHWRVRIGAGEPWRHSTSQEWAVDPPYDTDNVPSDGRSVRVQGMVSLLPARHRSTRRKRARVIPLRNEVALRERASIGGGRLACSRMCRDRRPGRGDGAITPKRCLFSVAAPGIHVVDCSSGGNLRQSRCVLARIVPPVILRGTHAMPLPLLRIGSLSWGDARVGRNAPGTDCRSDALDGGDKGTTVSRPTRCGKRPRA